MSHVALQRVMVRMLYDAAFTDEVLRDPATALRDVELSDDERAFLARPDPRAWKIDPERPRRSLTVLLQEYPASFALVHRSDGLGPLQAFFGTPRFHAVVQDRGSMAAAFGDHLVQLAEEGAAGGEPVTALARLEQATAKLRRRNAPASRPGRAPASAATGSDVAVELEDGRWQLSRDKSLHRAPAGTADLHEEIHLRLAETGKGLVESVLDTSIRLPDTPLRDGEDALLLELARDDGPRVKFAVGAAEITEGLYALLDFAAAPRQFGALCARIVELGADQKAAGEIIEGLIHEETLVPAEPSIQS